MNSNTKTSLNVFHDSKTQLIKFSDLLKGTKNATATSYRPDKSKIKKSTGKLELQFPKINYNINNVCVS